jgi:hypothetical protein
MVSMSLRVSSFSLTAPPCSQTVRIGSVREMCPIMRDTTTAFCGFAGSVAASRQGLLKSDARAGARDPESPPRPESDVAAWRAGFGASRDRLCQAYAKRYATSYAKRTPSVRESTPSVTPSVMQEYASVTRCGSGKGSKDNCIQRMPRVLGLPGRGPEGCR